MEFTGERMVPTAAGWDELFFEHVARYAFAARHVSGKRVLDAGSGSGYGTHFLSRAGAAQVVGVDLALETVAYSCRQFSRAGAAYLEADVLALPFPDRTFDVVVCFEVFEHVDPPTKLLEELRRVLAPEGVLLVSTPNALTYDPDTADGTNPFHVREYTPTHFRQLLLEHFPHTDFFVQNPFGGIGIFPANRSLDAAAGVELRVLSPREESIWGAPRDIHAADEKCAYLIAECGSIERSAGTGRLYAMATDLSDTTLERRAIDSYVERLTEEYGLLKNEQATSGAWVRSVVEELTTAKAELERLHSEHAALNEEYTTRTEWTRSLQKDLDEALKAHHDLEAYLHQVEAQVTNERESRLELQGRLEKQDAELLSLREALVERDHRTVQVRDLEVQLASAQELAARNGAAHATLEQSTESTLKWARELEESVTRTASEAMDLRSTISALEAAGEAERARTHVLESALLTTQTDLEEARRALEAAGRIDAERTEWARSLENELLVTQAQLEEARHALEAAGRTDAERTEWAKNLENELMVTQAALEQERQARAEWQQADMERTAWAKDLEQRLLDIHAEMARPAAHAAVETVVDAAVGFDREPPAMIRRND